MADGGTLNITAGGVVSNTDGVIGSGLSSTGVATVTGGGSQWNHSGDLGVGGLGNGTLNVTAGGAVSNTEGFIGFNIDSTGVATVTGPGSQWNNSSNLFVGNLGDGTLNVEAGGVVSNTEGFIGETAISTGVATVTGPGSQWNNSGNLFVGNFGDGTLNVTAGGVVSNGNSSVGRNTDSTGVVTVTGAGSQWNNSGNLIVGAGGDGTLNVEAGGVVSNATGFIGLGGSSTGVATVTGAGSQWNNSTGLSVGGFGGNGTLNVEAGGVISNADGSIGGGLLSTGVATVTGAGSQWNNSADLNVGQVGNGTLNVEAGGVVSNATGVIGLNGGSTGVATVAGAGSQWNNSGNLDIAPAGTGTLNIADNGLVAVGGTTSLGASGAVNLTGGRFEFGQTTFAEFSAINAVSGSMAGNLNHSGITDVSTLTILQNHPVDITDVNLVNTGLLFGSAILGTSIDNQSTGELTASAGQQVIAAGGLDNQGEINNLGGTVRFLQDATNQAAGFVGGRGVFGADGSWANEGVMAFSGGNADILGDVSNTTGGQIVTSGLATTTFFDDVIHNGTEIRTAAGSSTVIFGAASGAGSYTGTGTVFFEGDLRPGNSANIVDFEGDVAFGSQLNTQIEIAGTLLGEFDRLQIAGDLSLTGDLLVDLINGHTLGLNQQYEILTAGTLTGTFDGLGDGDLVGTFGSVDLFIDYDTTAGNVTLFTIPEPGSLALIASGGALFVGWRRAVRALSKSFSH